MISDQTGNLAVASALREIALAMRQANEINAARLKLERNEPPVCAWRTTTSCQCGKCVRRVSPPTGSEEPT